MNLTQNIQLWGKEMNKIIRSKAFRVPAEIVHHFAESCLPNMVCQNVKTRLHKNKSKKSFDVYDPSCLT